MQVILLEKISNLGSLGQVVKVRDGFARNFLLPRKKAKRATEAALKEFEVQREELERRMAEQLKEAQTQAEKLAGHTLRIVEKAGVDGRLFGSVTNHDIAHALQKQGFSVAKAQVRMPNGVLKTIGDHPIAIALHSDVLVDLTVSVSAEAA